MIASARDGDEPGDAARAVAAFAFVAVVSARRCACATSESRRSATQRAPVARAIAAAMRCVEPGGDVETTTSIPCSRTSRIPAGIAVTAHVAFSSGHDEAPQLQPRLRQRALEPSVPASTSRRLAAADADVARPVHPRLGRHPQALVAMQPARIVGREHVGLDPHRRQVLRELQRALDAAAAGGREVEADDQRLHGGDGSGTYPEARPALDARLWSSRMEQAAAEIDDAFHRLYYEPGETTWKQTSWLGQNVRKCPLDLWIYQEILTETRPDLIVESGTYRGGSALYLASVCDPLGHGQGRDDRRRAPPGRPRHRRITYLVARRR